MDKFSEKIHIFLDKKEYQRFYAWGVFFLITIGILFFFISLNRDSSKFSTLPNPSISNNTVQYAVSSKSNIILENRELINGTILSKSSVYLKGSGTLKISNGTSNNSIVKLITAETGKLIYFVYISANNTYTIKDISDNSYRVLFSSGTDWDGKMFIRNRSNQSFDDKLDYTTYTYSDGDYMHTKYTAYDLTLNPIVGGTAQTEDIDPNTFDKYK